MLKFISTKTHGILDYVVGAALAVSPWVFGFKRGGAETYIPVALGVGAMMYSIFTNYEFGAVKKIPMKAHLTSDALSGVLLAASPWLFRFRENVFAPHLAFGAFEIGTSLLTKTTSDTEATVAGPEAAIVPEAAEAHA